MKRAIIIPIFFLILQLVTVNASSPFAPTWMKPSAYTEYKSEPIGLFFLNGSTSMTMDIEGDRIIFRWECIELNDATAKLEVSLDFGEGDKGIHLSDVIYVDTISRDVFLSNGTLIGTTRLWFPASPTQDQELIFWDFPPEKIVTIADTGSPNKPQVTATIQGVQNFFFVEASGEIRGEQNFIPSSAYDFDTGVLILGFLDFEPMLLALGIKKVIGSAELVATNIDLGPREIIYDIRAALPYVAIIVALTLIFVAVYWQRRKKKKYSKH